MNESSSNIKQILSTFEKAIAMHESHEWMKNPTVEDIKIAFKLGNFVEKTIADFETQGSLSEFLKTVETWRRSHNKNSNYSQEFYSKMCDHLLVGFLKNGLAVETVIDVAFRIFASLFPKERLQVVLRDLIMTSASLDAIVDFAVINKNNYKVTDIKYEIILKEWCKEYEESRSEEKLVALISDELSCYKVQESLKIFMGILSLNRKHPVTELLLSNILHKMSDRSVLSKQFWLALVKNVERETVGEVCVCYKDFLVSFCDFLIYIGSMMDKEECNDGQVSWVVKGEISLCPEITYNELEDTFVFLSVFKNGIMKQHILNVLNDAKVLTELPIWEQIKHKCFLL